MKRHFAFVALTIFLSACGATLGTSGGDRAAPGHDANHDSAADSAEDLGTDPFVALSSLTLGNDHFMSALLHHPNQEIQRRKEIASGQHPKAIILSCSDSRVPPELIFDQGLGDLFVVRNAGEVPDKTALASIEYAIEHLGSRLIVVMGHESCGAVKAAISTPKGKSAGSDNLDYLVNQIRPHLEDTPVVLHDTLLNGPVRSHVDGVAVDLLRHSEIISHAATSGKIRIIRAVYRLNSGKVDFWH